MTQEPTVTHVEVIEQRIFVIRGQRVMLDADLAEIYGVATMRLNEQFRRNRQRFPDDFAFQLTIQEVADIMPQIATPSSHGGRRKRPWAFTEHGTIMLASVLNSPIAIEASVRVVRAFMHMREILAHSQELKVKFAELERRLDAHDGALKALFDAIRQLLEPPPSKTPRREIGFHMKEEARKYGVSLEKP